MKARRKEGEAALARALDEVDRAGSESWKLDAMDALRSLAFSNAWVTSEMVLDRVGRLPREPRLLGVIMRQGAQDGIIRATGQTISSERAQRQRGLVKLWMSEIFRGARPRLIDSIFGAEEEFERVKNLSPAEIFEAGLLFHSRDRK